MLPKQDFSTLSLKRTGAVATVTFSNPPVNIMDRVMVRELRGLLELLRADAEAKVVVFRSAHPDYFIAHADLNVFANGLDAAPPRSSQLNGFHSMLEGYRTLGKATIAVIEGRMDGAGTEFALSLDMQFAARGKARMGQFEVALGLLPGGTGTQRLPLYAGRARALELILGCDEIDAQTAELYGLVNRAFEPHLLWPFVERLAARIASFPLEAIALAKQAVDASQPSRVEGLLEENWLAGRLMARDESKRRMARILALGAQTPEFEQRLAEHLPKLADHD